MTISHIIETISPMYYSLFKNTTCTFQGYSCLLSLITTHLYDHFHNDITVILNAINSQCLTLGISWFARRCLITPVLSFRHGTMFSFLILGAIRNEMFCSWEKLSRCWGPFSTKCPSECEVRGWYIVIHKSLYQCPSIWILSFFKIKASKCKVLGWYIVHQESLYRCLNICIFFFFEK